MHKLITVIVSMAFLFTIFGCRTSKITSSVMAPQVHSDTVIKVKTDTTFIKDSIYVKDSVIIKESGDTIFFTKYQTKYIDKIKYKYLNTSDTIVKVDSIPYEVKTVETITTNKLNTLQKILLWIGVISMLIMVGNLAFHIYKAFSK